MQVHACESGQMWSRLQKQVSRSRARRHGVEVGGVVGDVGGWGVCADEAGAGKRHDRTSDAFKALANLVKVTAAKCCLRCRSVCPQRRSMIITSAPS